MPARNTAIPIQQILSFLEPLDHPVYKHYGLFEDDVLGSDLSAAQGRFSEFLQQQLADSLGEQGTIVLLGESFSHYPQRWSDCEKIHVYQNFEQLEENDRKNTALKDAAGDLTRRVVLIEGSLNYLDQLPLMNQCQKLFSNGDSLLVFGEFLDDDSKIEASTLPNLSSFKQLSARLGFEIRLERDLSKSASRSLDALLTQCVSKFENSNDCNYQLMSDIETRIREVSLEFSTKRRCFKYFHLLFNRPVDEKFPFAEYVAQGEFPLADIAALFEASFNTPFDESLWQWKYQLGDGKCVAARETPQSPVVSHYGGAPRDIQYFGKDAKAIQVCDVMVLPSMRRHYGNGSLFFKTAATFLEREIGNTVGHLLGFGFPNQKAMNIAIRLGLYEKTDDFVELVISPRRDETFAKHLVLAIRSNNPEHENRIEVLWQELKLALTDRIVGRRDWQYFKYRYFDHPLGKAGVYKRIFLIEEESQQPLAAIVLKEHGDAALIMDVICAPHKLDAVLHLLPQELAALGLPETLKFWITKAWLSRLELTGVIENSLGIEIPCNSWNRGPSAQELYGQWWLTAGDMDFM